ncbi:MAG: hypothetical protein AB1483_04710 [Candidatus Zixiibacteriota bacterium]
MSPARFRWGILLIQIGVLIMLANLDVINFNFLFDFLVFFAIVLIFVGIEKIFTKTKLQLISYLTSVGIFVVGLALAFNSSYGGQSGSYLSETTYRADFDPQVKKIRAVLDCDGTDLTIRDAGTDMVYGRFDRFTQKPKINFEVVDDIAQVELRGRSGKFLIGSVEFDTGDPQDWYLRFADNVPLDLECIGDESDMHLNMSTSRLERLKVEADDARIYVKIGTLEPLVTVNISGADSELKLRVPEDVGLKILGRNYESYLTTIGMIEADDGSFISAGYDTVATKVEINVDERLQSFVLDYF